MIKIARIPVFLDNYIFVIYHSEKRKAIVVDPGASQNVLEFLTAYNLTLTHILVTHHHHDHVDGIKELVKETQCEVIGFKKDMKRIPWITKPVVEGSQLNFWNEISAQVIETSGHTLGHVSYFFKSVNLEQSALNTPYDINLSNTSPFFIKSGTNENNEQTKNRLKSLLFCGDTLFSVGCGRLFEGTAEMMWESLCKLRALCENTLVFCAHEYTTSNIQYALYQTPLDNKLKDYALYVSKKREQGRATVPFFLSDDKEINPFLRADFHYYLKKFNTDNPTDVFSSLRTEKDNF